MRNFNEYIERKKQEYNEKFDQSELNKDFIKYYENQERITVLFCDKSDKEYERKRGRIGITTGWRPCFLLMLTSRSSGSSYTIGENDKIV